MAPSALEVFSSEQMESSIGELAKAQEKLAERTGEAETGTVQSTAAPATAAAMIKQA